MRIITKEYEVYKYNELSDKAKEKAKQWYLEGQTAEVFSDMCKEDLKCLFGKNHTLDVEYSLNYCQGDGFNIYGEVNAEDIFNCLEQHNGGTQLEKFENALTDKEKRTILNYQNECGDIKLPHNRHYGYCMANYLTIADDWKFDLENYSCYKNINVDVLEKFEYLVKEIFTTLCNGYEKQGYEFFYEVDDEQMEEVCEANEYEFLVDGEFYY